MDERQARKDMVLICRMLYDRGLIVATDGNVSVRLGAGRVLTTPRGRNKGLLQARDLVVTDLAGRPADGSQAPSTELLLHLAVYGARPDVGAVVHAHPPIATAFSIAGLELDACMLPEVIVFLGRIATARYATPGTAEGPAAIRDLIAGHDAVILDHHGALTTGRTLEEAYNRMETVEHTARINLAARQLGGVQPLSGQQVAPLLRARAGLGLPGTDLVCGGEEERLQGMVEAIARDLLGRG